MEDVDLQPASRRLAVLGSMDIDPAVYPAFEKELALQVEVLILRIGPEPGGVGDATMAPSDT
jgi:hypothetical protein